MDRTWLRITDTDLRTERAQLTEEGRDLSSLAEEFDSLDKPGIEDDPALTLRAQALLDAAQRLPLLAACPHREPSDLAGIRRERPAGPRKLPSRLSDDTLFDRIHGAWLGRCAGCLLGKPIEGMRSSTLWPYLKELGKYPLRDYFRGDEPAGIMKAHGVRPEGTYIEQVTGMPEDDDTNYTTIGFAILKRHGKGFTPENVAEFWMREVPILHTCTAERIAYRNLALAMLPPQSATFRNPYREWIGAQIRADFFGYAAPGEPERAAEYAWRDACISHVKNGIYGEMWVAAMLAAAPLTRDVTEVIRIGLSEIPVRSRLAEGLLDVMAWRQEGVGFEEAIARIHRRWDEKNAHQWCHTISNAQIVAMGLLWSEGDFETAICRAVQACFDTDCNGATVGSVMGMMLGAKALPAKWIAPLRDSLATGVAGYHSVRISEIARAGFEVMKTLRG
jgi:hypothetical protein